MWNVQIMSSRWFHYGQYFFNKISEAFSIPNCILCIVEYCLGMVSWFGNNIFQLAQTNNVERTDCSVWNTKQFTFVSSRGVNHFLFSFFFIIESMFAQRYSVSVWNEFLHIKHFGYIYGKKLNRSKYSVLIKFLFDFNCRGYLNFCKNVFMFDGYNRFLI